MPEELVRLLWDQNEERRAPRELREAQPPHRTGRCLQEKTDECEGC
jgi:hypothetical protein